MKEMKWRLVVQIMLLALFSIGLLRGQVEVYIGSYGSNGYPDYIVGRDDLSSEFLGRIGAAVPEGYPVPQYHPSYLTNNFSANVKVTEKTELFMTYVQEGAGYRNVVGYYKYPTDSPPSQRSDLDTLFIAFPNFSQQYSGGRLVAGDKVSLGEFEEGTTVAFFLKANAYNSRTNSVGNGHWTHFSDKLLNNDVVNNNDLNQHTIVLYDAQMDKYVVGFEDITRPGGDKDFNDAIFYITSSVVSAVETDDIAGLPVVWEGTIDSDWNNPLNWSPNIIPDSTSNISISASAINDPVIEDEVDISAITVDPGAELSFSEEAVVYIDGDITDVTSGLTDASIVLDGEKPQYVFGNPEFTDLSIESEDTVFIEEGMTIVENLAVSSGVLVTNDNLTIVNENSYTTSVLETGEGKIDGEITIQTVIPSPDGYHYVASPLLSQTLADIHDDYPLVGLGGDLASIPFPNIWIYDETVVSTHQIDGWKTPASLDHEMKIGEGFAFNVAEGSVIELTGEPFSGDLSLNLSWTDVPDDGLDHSMCPPEGWHLVGNPYPAVIDWDKVSLQNMDDAVYTWDHNYHRYATYIDGVGVNGGSRYIAAMQGFFVRASREEEGLESELTFADSMKVTSMESGPVFRSSELSLLRFELKGSHGVDEMIIRFDENSTNGFEAKKDAFKINSGNDDIPNVASRISSEEVLSINTMPIYSMDTIPLYIQASYNGLHELTLTEFKADYDKIFLLSTESEEVQDLTLATAKFNLNYREEYTEYALVLEKFTPSSVLDHGLTYSLIFHQGNLYVEVDNQVTLEGLRILDLSGREVLNKECNSNQINQNIKLVAKGVYLVQLETSHGLISDKLVVR